MSQEVRKWWTQSEDRDEERWIGGDRPKRETKQETEIIDGQSNSIFFSLSLGCIEPEICG